MPGLPFVRVTGHPAIGVASPPFYSTAVAVTWVLSFDAIRVNASLISVRLAQVLEAILGVSTRLRLSGLVMTRWPTQRSTSSPLCYANCSSSPKGRCYQTTYRHASEGPRSCSRLLPRLGCSLGTIYRESKPLQQR